MSKVNQRVNGLHTERASEMEVRGVTVVFAIAHGNSIGNIVKKHSCYAKCLDIKQIFALNNDLS